MLPPIKQFEESVRKLGINKQSIIVVYDAMGIFSSPRAWWMFKIMGHEQVYILDGGLPCWLKAGFSTHDKLSQASSTGDFTAIFNHQLVVAVEQVVKSLEQSRIKIIDARSRARFDGIEPEPRAGLRGGHIPKSFCLPFNEVLENGKFKIINNSKSYLRNFALISTSRLFSVVAQG